MTTCEATARTLVSPCWSTRSPSVRPMPTTTPRWLSRRSSPMPGNGPELRVITWRVNVNTQAISGLMDSGPLKVEKMPAAGRRAGHLPSNGRRFRRQLHRRHRRNGVAIRGRCRRRPSAQHGRRGSRASDFDGDAFSLDADQVATAPLGPTSYVAAIEEGGKVALTTWERRVEGCFFTLCTYEPYMVGHSHDDGNPIQKGVAIPEPVLGHAYEISATTATISAARLPSAISMATATTTSRLVLPMKRWTARRTPGP